MLLLHGLCSSPLEVRQFARLLRDQGFTVVTPTLAGYSASDVDADTAAEVAPADFRRWIADCVVEITETGRALAAARLRVVETLLVSRTELIANPASASDPDKRLAMGHVMTLLQGALEARGKVLLKLNVSARKLEAVVSVLPALKAPTVSELAGGGGFAVETVVPKSEVNVLIPALKDRGATDIIELPISKIVH